MSLPLLKKRLVEECYRLLARLLYPLLKGLPVVLSVETSSACNARCEMCPSQIMPRAGALMRDEVFGEILKQLPGINVRLVILSLIGEPLLDPKLPERIRQVSGMGYRTRIVTNASLLTPAMSRKLLDSGLSELYASLNGLDEKSHQAIMNFTSPQYRACVANLEFFAGLSAGRVSLHLNSLDRTVPPAGMREEFRRRWEAKGFKVNIAAPEPWHKAGKPAAGRRYPCRLLFSGMFIDCDGNALACCRDYASTLKIGNVLSESLAEIWRGKPLERLRAEHLAGRAGGIPACSNCTLSAGVNLPGLLRSLITGRHDDT